MTYTMDDYRREFALENLNRLTVAERLAGLRPEQLLAAFTPDQIEAYLKRVNKKPATTKRKKRKPRA